jgi:hypothetical protein
MRRSRLVIFALLACMAMPIIAGAGGIEVFKHIIAAPAPVDEPTGFKTPDGTFNVRDPNAPFHSERLADAMWLDAGGRNKNGDYLDLNHAVYSAYKHAGDGKPDTVLVLMPGTWAGAMSMDRFARDVIRMAERHGRRGLQVWLHDRRSEQMEDHTGLMWAARNKDRLPTDEVILGVSDYYRPGFRPEEGGVELLGRKFTPLDHDAVRFMAGWGADVAVRDWRAVVLEAHRKVGNKVEGTEADRAKVTDKSKGRVFIGGHSLGGSLTVLYASYDFDRRPDREIWGVDDVHGLVQLEGGSLNKRKVKTVKADKYRKDLQGRYEGGMVYFDLDVLGIRYAPSTMLSVGISGWAAYNARGQETIFPDYSRPSIVQLPRITNEALLGFAMDDDISPFFIARVSMGYPSGKLGRKGQIRTKTVNVPLDPGECPVLTPWKPGHRPVDPDYVYDWVNIDEAGSHPAADGIGRSKCKNDDPEVTDFYDFARSVIGGPHEYEEMPWLSTGPNDFPEWYFPPRLSSDSGRIGSRIVDHDAGVELYNGTGTDGINVPAISFVGDDSMGEFSVPGLSEKDFVPGVLAHNETRVHNIFGYTHLDITAATRNNQPDLKGEFEDYNACAVYSYRFMEAVTEQ